MSKALINLNEALNRLISNTPIRVPKGSKINNDTVALEAGLKRGAVKRLNRTGFVGESIF